MNNQNGAIAILTAILLTALLGFVALSVDTGYMFASKNELQNAADAGALAGARELYKEDGTGVNEGCNEVAYDAATQNLVAKDAIEIIGDGLTNDEDIQRGHWSFATREFTQSDETDIDLWDNDGNIIPKDVLDADVNFVNAVQVTVRRETDPITLFFAKILGQSEAKMSATAVAYIGFAGTFYKTEFDAPVALCEEHLGTDPNHYDCGVAVWYEHAETAMWTNLSQETKQADGTCTSANANDVKKLIDTGNTAPLYAGTDLGVTNGMVDVAHSKLSDKWEVDSKVDGEDETHRKIVTMTLPVIKCKDELGQTNTCAELVGGVTVELLWFNTESASNKAYEKAPYVYYEADGKTEIFNSSDVPELDATDDVARWNAFAKDPGIKLLDSNEVPLPIANNQMYFRASCETAMLPTGGPGGENFGILSKIPVLVD